jgi:hypothetical protein
VLARQLLEHALVGRVAGLRLLDHGQRELLEQDPLQLLGRVDAERLACELEDACFDLRELRLVLFGQRPQPLFVDPHTRALDATEHSGQRHLDLLEQLEQPVALELFAQRRLQVANRRHLIRGPAGQRLVVEFCGGGGLGAAAGKILEARDTSIESL